MSSPVDVPPPSSQSPTSEAPVGVPAQGCPTSTSSCMLTSSAVGPNSNAAAPVVAPSNQDFSPTTAVTVSSTPFTALPAPRASQGTASDLLQDPVRAKFVTSPGYVVPTPFPHTVFPRVNSASGIPQQTPSAPVLKLTPPMSPAALQPPVPGQSLVNRPSFSYNIASQLNAGSASGQQFQPTIATSQRHLQIGNPVPPLLAAVCLQPPVPRQPLRSIAPISGTVPQNFLPPVPAPLPKGQQSTSMNFSFGGSPKIITSDLSNKNLPSSTCATNAVASDAGTTLGASTNSDTKLSNNMPTTSSAPSATSIPSSSSMLLPAGLLITGRPVGNCASINLPAVHSLSVVHSAPLDSSPGTMRPPVPNQPSAPANPSSIPNTTLHNVPQQIYPPSSSVSNIPPPSQPQWLHPPPLQYPGALPGPFPFPVRGPTPPAIPFSNVKPPGVLPQVATEVLPSSTSESSISVRNGGAGSPPPDASIEKETSDIQQDEGNRKSELEAWTVHKTESGVTYYYNSLTGISTYERPSNFNGVPEMNTVQIIPVSWEKLPGTNWTLVTTNDGKKYYYDSISKVSSWQVPAEVLEMRKNQELNSAKEENASIFADKGNTPTPGPISTPAAQTGGRDSLATRTSSGQVSASALDLIKKKLQDSGTPIVSAPLQAIAIPFASDLNGTRVVDASVKGELVVNSKDKMKDDHVDGDMSDSSSDSDDAETMPTKDECLIQFKEMLRERGVAPFSKWEKELPKIVFDPRFKAVPSYSTRRAIFEQYVRTRAEEERKEKKAAQRAAIDGFKKMLEEASEYIDYRTDFQTFKRKWSGDPRFEALDRKERELLFNEKVVALKKAVEGKIQAERAASVTSFKSMLKERQDITTSSRWSKVKDTLRNDPRYKSVNHGEREALFNEYIAELKSEEDEAERSAKAKMVEQNKLKEREREMRKRKEREEHEMERMRLKVRRKEAVTSFQALLVETIKDPKASWTESKLRLEKDPQGRASNPDLSQADAEKLFRDHVKDLYERCVRDFRALLGDVITADAAARITEEGKNVLNSWSEAKRLLKPDPRYSKMPRKDRDALWQRYTQDLLRKQQKDQKDKPDIDRKNTDSPNKSPRRSHGRK
ncbi:Pre-mRNA-processing protein 40C [Apostasia shenzhenica]|uniref:Pre-mRNA-processing protein 40C n=1 Tax=Apostasia shenzhenica TaxID=1088818 RepID=A0A2I0B4P0_9ASPA|nr:Pre-mRNA-processing protein 40C [Apostasia shenzhenica]